jgi:hypothetical protein
LPVVRSLLGPYLVFLSSTVNGYEWYFYFNFNWKLLLFLKRSLISKGSFHFFSNNSDFLYFAPFNQAKCTPLIKLWRHSYIDLHLSSCIKLWRYWPILVTKTSAAIGRTKPDIF